MNTPVEGLTTRQSDFGPQETMNRLEAQIRARRMGVFARINHAALAAEAGLKLRPTELILFGSPRGGTPLMQANQTMGIDLPLKALVWHDASGKPWLSYNAPAWLAKRCTTDRTRARNRRDGRSPQHDSSQRNEGYGVAFRSLQDPMPVVVDVIFGIEPVRHATSTARTRVCWAGGQSLQDGLVRK